ncbi:MAG: serine/threonine protein kinase, partial [Streptomyces sp.]|nr:serine/threonine protein kinase [Streptomyces sp.]
GTGNAEAGTPPGPAAPLSHPRPPHPPRHLLHRPAALAFLGTLLLTALCLGVVLLPDATAGTPDGWARHREEGMHAVLVLPARYDVSERRGGAADPPRVVVYADADADASVRIRFTQWDTAPGSPMSRARQAREGWDGARTRYARTTVQGHEAVVADTTYRRGDGSPARALELLVRTDDWRMYSLRVDMPRSGAHEREGAAVFEGARDRMEIGND